MRRYHHIGIPTTEAKPGETHLKHLKLFVVSHEKSEFGVEWMRFEADAAVPDLVRQVPHVAFEAQIESAVALAIKNLQARGSTEVETRLSEMCGHLRTIQNRIEDSFSASVTAQGEEAVQSIAQQFEGIAQQSMEKWRLALAKDLNSVANTLGQRLRQELEPEAGES